MSAPRRITRPVFQSTRLRGSRKPCSAICSGVWRGSRERLRGQRFTGTTNLHTSPAHLDFRKLPHPEMLGPLGGISALAVVHRHDKRATLIPEGIAAHLFHKERHACRSALLQQVFRPGEIERTGAGAGFATNNYPR